MGKAIEKQLSVVKKAKTSAPAEPKPKLPFKETTNNHVNKQANTFIAANDSHEEVQEVINIEQEEMGKVIGSKGMRIRALRVKKDCRIDINTYKDHSDTELCGIFIKGKPSNVANVKSEIAKILLEPDTRGKYKKQKTY
jgi:hypothetical protein